MYEVNSCYQNGVITMAYPSGAMTLLNLRPGEFVEFARLYLAHNIPHSASCAIGKVLRRFRDDWMRLFPEAIEPRLVVSWSDQEYHKGTIYKAANFQWLRESPGAAAGGLRRGHKRWGERGRYADLGHTKDCWIFWLNTPPFNKGVKLTAAPVLSAVANGNLAQPQLIPDC